MPINFINVGFTYLPNTPIAHQALKDINLTIDDGKIYALIGHTGSGKSTLAQLINALMLPTSGEVHVDINYEKFVVSPKGKMRVLRKLRKEAGLVFQFPEYQLFEETVLKDVAFGPKNFGMKEEEALNQAKKCLSLVGIKEDYYQKSPFELSGGEKRRVAIAGILALEPKVLILDEPTAGLDPLGAKEIMELFVGLNKRLGKTIIIITHEMNQVLKYCDEVIAMKNAEVLMIGSPTKVFSDPRIKEDLDQPLVSKVLEMMQKRGISFYTSSIKDEVSLAKAIASKVIRN